MGGESPPRMLALVSASCLHVGARHREGEITIQNKWRTRTCKQYDNTSTTNKTLKHKNNYQHKKRTQHELSAIASDNLHRQAHDTRTAATAHRENTSHVTSYHHTSAPQCTSFPQSHHRHLSVMRQSTITPIPQTFWLCRLDQKRGRAPLAHSLR